MLESLGYEESPERELRRRDPLQHLLDPRGGGRAVRRPPRDGAARQARAPGRHRRRRRLLGAVGEGRGVRAVPVRRRGVRARPGAQARGVPDVGLDHRSGLLRVRGLHRPPADAPRARVLRMDADQRRLQLPLLVLHRAEHARPRGQPAARGARRRGRAPRRRRRARGHAARPERQQLRPRPGRDGRAPLVRRAARGDRRRRRHRPDPLHEPAPEGHARGRRARARAAASPSASTCTCRSSPDRAGSSRRCAAPTTARASWTAPR